MHVLLIGCGRSGRQLAKQLVEQGIDVVALDRNKQNLDKMIDVSVELVEGYPIDLDVLDDAGIRQASAVIALDDNENTNIMVCEIAKTVFGVKRCLARIYSPDNIEFVQKLGIDTICSTQLTVDHTLNFLASNSILGS